MKPPDTNADPLVLDSRTRRPGLQFSVRDLLIVTTIVSICLAVGVHFAGFLFVVVTIGLIQVAILLAADWLIRPENRRVFAFVTAGSWATLGSGLLVLSLRAIYEAIDASDPRGSSTLALCLAIGAGVCYLLAALRWRRLSKPVAKGRAERE